jgi:hypothetical protein
MKKHRRTSPANLVKSSESVRHGKKWIVTLNAEDRRYVKATAAAMTNAPNAAPYQVARHLKDEINATATVGTIVRTLKELITNG